MERYAYDCKISTTAIYRVLQNSRKRPLLLEQLICLYEHREPTCKVTMEQLFKANGMVLAKNGASVKIRAIQSEHEAVELVFGQAVFHTEGRKFFFLPFPFPV